MADLEVVKNRVVKQQLNWDIIFLIKYWIKKNELFFKHVEAMKNNDEEVVEGLHYPWADPRYLIEKKMNIVNG